MRFISIPIFIMVTMKSNLIMVEQIGTVDLRRTRTGLEIYLILKIAVVLLSVERVFLNYEILIIYGSKACGARLGLYLSISRIVIVIHLLYKCIRLGNLKHRIYVDSSINIKRNKMLIDWCSTFVTYRERIKRCCRVPSYFIEMFWLFVSNCVLDASVKRRNTIYSLITYTFLK